jgi:hypothetical protein
MVGGALPLFGLSLYAASVKSFSSFGQLPGLEAGGTVTGGV